MASRADAVSWTPGRGSLSSAPAASDLLPLLLAPGRRVMSQGRAGITAF